MGINNCDYKCEECDTVFEHVKKNAKQAFPANHKLKCPECGSKKTNRVWAGKVNIVYGKDFLKW